MTAEKIELVTPIEDNKMLTLRSWLSQEGIVVKASDRKAQMVEKVKAALKPTPKIARIEYQTGMDYPSDPQNYSKDCPCCGKYLPLNTFGKRNMPAGPRPQTWCKPCRGDKARMTKNERKRDTYENQLIKKCKLKTPPDYITDEVGYLNMNRLKKTGWEIDFQKQRVYDAEDFLCKPSATIATIEQAHDIVKRITKSAWWKNRFGDTKVRVVPSKSKTGSNQCMVVGPNNIQIDLAFSYAGKASYYILLHELAHIPGRLYQNPHSGHGPLFCAVLLDIVAKWGEEGWAQELQESFDASGVKYQNQRPNQKAR